MNQSSLKLRLTRKVFLLCALVCAGQMYGMESYSAEASKDRPENPRPELGIFGYLPKELHQKIIRDAIESSNTVDEAIKAINTASALYGLKYDTSTATDLLMKRLPDNIDEAINTVKHLQGTTLKDFTALVSILAKKFSDIPRSVIASKFNTPIADQYVNLGIHLMRNLTQGYSIDNVIQQGVDVNFTTYIKKGSDQKIMTPLFVVGYASSWKPKPEVIQLLLNHGADQYFNVEGYGTLLETLKKNYLNSAIIEILEKAREEKQSVVK